MEASVLRDSGKTRDPGWKQVSCETPEDEGPLVGASALRDSGKKDPGW